MIATANGSFGRRHDWTHLLEHWIDAHRVEPFAWGRNDCVTFAAGWVERARPDLDPSTDLSEQLDYRSARGALKRLAGRELAAAVDAWGRLTAVAPTFAQRGDLVLVENNGRPGLCICVGEYAAGPGSAGLELVTMSAAQRAWRV